MVKPPSRRTPITVLAYPIMAGPGVVRDSMGRGAHEPNARTESQRPHIRTPYLARPQPRLTARTTPKNFRNRPLSAHAEGAWCLPIFWAACDSAVTAGR